MGTWLSDGVGVWLVIGLGDLQGSSPTQMILSWSGAAEHLRGVSNGSGLGPPRLGLVEGKLLESLSLEGLKTHERGAWGCGLMMVK